MLFPCRMISALIILFLPPPESSLLLPCKKSPLAQITYRSVRAALMQGCRWLLLQRHRHPGGGRAPAQAGPWPVGCPGCLVGVFGMVLPALCDLHSSARLKFPRELLRAEVPSVTARQAVPLQRFALAHNSQTSISTHHLKKLGQLLKSQAIKTLKCLLAAQSHHIRGSEEIHCTCQTAAEACT